MRILLIAIAAIVSAVFAIGISIGLLFDINHYKPQIEAAVAKATGMEVKIERKVSLKIFPAIRIVLVNVHISNRGSQLFEVNEIQLFPHLMPFLLRREVLVDQNALEKPKVSIEKSIHGHSNYETNRYTKTTPSKHSKSGARVTAGLSGQIQSVKIHQGTFSYKDDASGEELEIQGIDAQLADIAWKKSGNESKEGVDLMKSVTFQGHLRAQSIQGDSLGASDFKARLRADQGILYLDSTEVRFLGGVIQGSGQIDLRKLVPTVELIQKAQNIDLSQIPTSGRGQISGIAEAAIDLTVRGKDIRSIVRTMNGEISIHSQNITYSGVDIDETAHKFKVTQGMDLINLGSFLMAGPLAPLVEQPSQGIHESSKAKSIVRNLVSDWHISNGFAQAKDVAFSTSKTIVAFKGSLNLINQTYRDFSIATVDSKGCAKTVVEIAGSLKKPYRVASSVEEQLAEKALEKGKSVLDSAGTQIAGIFEDKLNSITGADSTDKKQSSNCQLFYSGEALKTG